MLLSQQEFSKFALDYLVFSNGFLEPRHNALGEPLRLETSPAKFTRRGTEEGVYWFFGGITIGRSNGNIIKVFHLGR
jgi:capsid portal protein